MDRTSNKPEPRRYHGSQIGLMCPVDSPDGRNIGYIKSLAVMAQISTAFPSAKVRELLTASKLVRPLADIHPATWDPRWTPVFLNSDLVGGCVGNTMALVAMLVDARRNGTLDKAVSVGWSPVNNLLRITCDSGRPVRPVYREGVTIEAMRATKTWDDIAKNLTDTNNPISRSIIASSNMVSAAICAQTNQQPSNVCNSKGVQAAKKALHL
jgi:DNA-directed RNA polymerase subunit B